MARRFFIAADCGLLAAQEGEEADKRGKLLYVAINTVVKDSELRRLAESLAWVEALGLDGVIVQDLGVAELARRHFPRLALHASTQMAVHNSSGIRVLREMGFRRVILARELTLEQIAAIRGENPDIELEVFIHGALCYGFSGICFASWALTGRSGNRGECAQICRSRFRIEPDEATGAAGLAGEGHFFSCRDLAADRLALDLARIGVDALKIEGRMKSPEYVSTTVALYRALLDRGAEIPEAELEELRRRQQLTFSRSTTRGYLKEGHGDGRLVDAEWPGHRGVPVGKAAAVGRDSLTLALEGDLALRDGLQYFPAGRAAVPVQFAVRGLRVKGAPAVKARSGELARLDLPDGARSVPPQVGQTLFQISARALDLKEVAEGSFPFFRIPCGCAVAVGPDRVSVSWSTRLWSAPVELEAALETRPARGSTSLGTVIERLFAEAGESHFRPGRVETSVLDGGDALFVQPSLLKRLKNEAYAALERRLDAWIEERASAAAAGPPEPHGERISIEPAAAPDRGLLSGRNAAVPFTLLREVDAAQLHTVGRRIFLPLAPVATEEESALAALDSALDRLLAEAPERRVAVGLSNIGHLGWVAALAAKGRVDFFIDFPLYVANRWAYAFYRDRIPGLLFQYFWIEGDDAGYRELRAALAAEAALARIEATFEPPLFTGLGCFLRNNGAAAADACRGCPREHAFRLTQGRNRFVVRVRDCVTYVFRDR